MSRYSVVGLSISWIVTPPPNICNCILWRIIVLISGRFIKFSIEAHPGNVPSCTLNRRVLSSRVSFLVYLFLYFEYCVLQLSVYLLFFCSKGVHYY